MKLGVFDDQAKSRLHAFAAWGDPEEFGRLLRQHADALQLEQASESLSPTDGGPWIRNPIMKHLKRLTAMILDFYHLSEHVWSAARCCLGEGEEAKVWAETQLQEIKHVGPRSGVAAMNAAHSELRHAVRVGSRSGVAAIDALRRKLRGAGQRNALRLLRG